MKAVRNVLRTAMAPKSSKAGKKTEPVMVKEPAQAINIDKNGDFVIKILAKPGSKENAITGITEEGLEVKIGAPPVDGEANTELISYLSKLFGIRKSDLSLDRGSRSRVKTVTVSKDTKLTLEKLNEVVQTNIGK